MATQTRENSNNAGKKKYNFEDFEYDVEKMPPALPAGKFDFVIDRVEVKQTKSGDPYLNCKMKVEKAHDEENENAEGKSLFEMIIFYKSNDAGGAAINKRKLRQLCEQAEIELDEVPKRVSQETLEEFAEVLKDKTFTGWVTHREEDTGEIRANLNYTEPSNGGLSLGGDSSSSEEDEKPAGKKASAKKTSRR